MDRRIVALVAVSFVLSALAIGWTAWVALDPERWFPAAFTEKGPRGDEGPRGPRGPAGPPGPVGPDALEAVDSLSFRLDELDGALLDSLARIDAIESDLGASDLQLTIDQLGSTIDDVRSDLDEVAATVDDLCDEFSYYEGAFYEIWSYAC